MRNRRRAVRSRRSRVAWSKRWRRRPAAEFHVLEPTRSTSLPVETHEGIAPVAVTGDWQAAHLVSDSLRATVLRIALPAVASSLLMTLFSSVDAFWVGTRIGATGL